MESGILKTLAQNVGHFVLRGDVFDLYSIAALVVARVVSENVDMISALGFGLVSRD